MEVILARDLQPIGLSAYLIDGIGLPEEQVGPDRAMLDGLSGLVLIVRSPAFADVEGRISLSGELSLVGTYREPTALPDFEPLVSEAARGKGDESEPLAPHEEPGREQGRGSHTVILIIASIVILLLLLFFLLG